MTMPSEVTCEQVDRSELDVEYLRGRLDPEQAEAFEAHFFGCEKCWELVQGGLQVRATRPAARASIKRQWWLLAAAVLVVALGIRLWQSDPRGTSVAPDNLRTGTSLQALQVHALGDRAGPGAWWNIITGAASYRVRLFSGDGGLILERETTDTSLTVPRDSLRPPGPHYWQIQALDRIGAELARSGLVEVVHRPTPRTP